MGKNFNFKQISNSYVIQEPNQVGQAKKSAGRMPWHQEPKKDVVSCEKLRLGEQISIDPQISEWGNPVRQYRITAW